ncbi:MAG: TRAP transporter small permease [Betaproteobacteria bacterium]
MKRVKHFMNQSHRDEESPADESLGRSAYRRVLALVTDGVCGFAVLGIVLIVLVQVAARLSGSSIKFSEELTRALFIWMVFIGIAASMRHADAARVTVMMEALPKPFRRMSLPIYLFFSLGFFVLMGWTGWKMVSQQLMMNEMIATLGWPSWVVGLIMPLSAVLAILCTLDSLHEHKKAIALVVDGALEPAKELQ